MLVMGKRRSKKKHSKHSRKTTPQKLSIKQGLLSKISSLLSPTGWFFALIVFLLTIVTAYYTFAPKLTVYPSEPNSSTDPFKTKFILRNDGYLWVNIIDPYKCIVNKLSGPNNKLININISMPITQIPRIESYEATSIYIPFNNYGIGTRGPINYVDVEIIVSYYPAFFPYLKIFNKEYRIRFITQQLTDGTLKWIPKARSEK